jgi:hypothetical protein
MGKEINGADREENQWRFLLFLFDFAIIAEQHLEHQRRGGIKQKKSISSFLRKVVIHLGRN